MPESTLLITPELQPSATTIKRGLLRSHRISVIVPENWHEIPEALKAHPEVWVPTRISEHMNANTGVFERTIIEAGDVVRRFPKLKPGSRNTDRLIASKLPYQLEFLMKDKGLIRENSDEPGVYDVNQKDLLPSVLAIFGRNIAHDLKDEGWVCSFSTTINARRAIAADISNAADNANAVMLKLYEVPEPHPDASISDILNFRQANRRLFEAYIHSVNEVRELLEVKAGASGDLLMAINEGIRESDKALSQLRDRDAPFAQIKRSLSDGARNPATLVLAGTSAASMIIDALDGANAATQLFSLGGLLAAAAFNARQGWAGSAYLRKAVSARVLAPF